MEQSKSEGRKTKKEEKNSAILPLNGKLSVNSSISAFMKEKMLECWFFSYSSIIEGGGGI